MNKTSQQLGVSRRNLLKFGAVALGTSVVASQVGSQLIAPEPAVAQNDMSPDEALQRLMDGNQRFIGGKPINPNRSLARLRQVAQTQKPFAALLTCADSRIPAEILFDQGFGDLFMCRVAGNVVTPEEMGSLEFGTLVLGAKLLMVMGHKKCGAVDATIKGAQVPGQIGSLLDAIKPALQISRSLDKDRLESTTKANVLVQVENLKKSSVISQLIKENKLKVVGGYFDFDTGVVSMVS
ncbi:carbonic anhydrase [Planktothrix sp. FACHB-1355]|uniref:carbonic anhydrase n=1 Tax=Aerosakkonema funiforme FACHB-1375 TaxID=2949571 RepID=A0A926VFT2_9CYAN|nr:MULTISPECIES: carbonic anhydrase [Oscillatoriales]MBD2182865.1 carbonic anhydrase [Aerosakkonema funiforme FACHB-1375]MBD3560675.1 carbonic anhydrase [Planktothrix sp. FACHB-1355]